MENDVSKKFATYWNDNNFGKELDAIIKNTIEKVEEDDDTQNG